MDLKGRFLSLFGKTRGLTKLNWWALAVTAVFTLIYCSISLFNHYYLRTENLDYGLYTNALWDYGHFQFNYSECLNEYRQNLLYDHFDLYLILFAPLGYVFKTYTLLVVQIASISLAGWAIFRIARKMQFSNTIAVLAMVLFYAHFSIYSALSFDYHSNVVAAMFLPWFALAIFENRTKAAWVLLLLILIGKENMGLFMVFVCFGFAVVFFKEARKRNLLVGMGLFSAVYFVLVLEVIMPSLSDSGSYGHFHYDVLGEGMVDALINLISRPFYYFQYLYKSQHDQSISAVKLEFWVFFIVSGGLLLVRKPVFLLMLIPIFFQKMYSSRGQCWGINDQYAIELVPIATIGILYVASTIRNERFKRLLMLSVIIGSVIITHLSLTDSIKGPENYNGQFFVKEHYASRSDRSVVMEGLALVPPDAPVVGTSQLMSQLAYRDYAYRLPQTEYADYFVQDKLCSTYPLKRHAMDELVQQLKDSGEWEILADNKYMLVLRRKVSVKP